MSIESSFYFLPEKTKLHCCSLILLFLVVYKRYTKNINIQKILKLCNFNHCAYDKK